MATSLVDGTLPPDTGKFNQPERLLSELHTESLPQENAVVGTGSWNVWEITVDVNFPVEGCEPFELLEIETEIR
jgi:hypothetical protein